MKRRDFMKTVSVGCLGLLALPITLKAKQERTYQSAIVRKRRKNTKIKCKMCGEREIRVNEFGSYLNKIQLPIRQDTDDNNYFLSRIIIRFTDEPIICVQCQLETVHDISGALLASKSGVRKMSIKERSVAVLNCIKDEDKMRLPKEKENENGKD